MNKRRGFLLGAITMLASGVAKALTGAKMPVPATIADLSSNAALNSPAGSSPVGPELDNHLRAHGAIIKQLAEDLASSDPGKGAALIGIGGGRTQADKNAEIVSVKDFGAVGDGLADDTAALTSFLNHCRSTRLPGIFHAGTFLISSALDISGVDIEGVLGGFNNKNGTTIKGSGGHPLFVQNQTNSNNITYSIRNFRLIDGTTALRMSYAIHCRIENIFIENCVDGIECGVQGVLGPLWCNFKNCRASVSGTALKVNGNDFANANIFDTCYFKGAINAATIDSTGGIGAVANHFLNTEFSGDGRGVTLYRNKSSRFDNCYFESKGPAVVIDNYTLDLSLESCVFGTLRSDNVDGIPAFIWHKSGTCRMTISAGYVYINAGAQYDNLRMVHSDDTSLFYLEMQNLPDLEISASGFAVFDVGLPTTLCTLTYQAAYSPAWTTSGTQPSLGNGTLTGRYALTGRTCTAEFSLTAGSTTTFGSGQFQISLPFPARAGGERAQGVARVSDLGTVFYVALAEVAAGSSNAVFYTNNSANLVQSTSPMTWAAGDVMRCTITYEI